MKSILKLLLVLSMSLSSTPIFAQSEGSSSKEEITLTVSSDGPTKDEALKNALRTAIEQAYGAFVSANTTILNDEVVKDEIVTISNGAIKEYKEISSYEKPDGKGYNVTTTATVSLPHLITYAKNHGSECEFAGKTFGMQMKLWNIQKENEKKVLDNLLKQIEELLPSMITCELTVNEPTVCNINFSDCDYLYKEYRYDKVKEKPVEIINEKLKKRIDNLPSDYYEVGMDLKFTIYDVRTLILETLKSLSINEEERENAEQRNVNCLGLKFDYDTKYWLRNDGDTISRWLYKLNDMVICEMNKFSIEDNTGELTDLSISDFISSLYFDNLAVPYSDLIIGNTGYHYDARRSGVGISKSERGLFKYPFTYVTNSFDQNGDVRYYGGKKYVGSPVPLGMNIKLGSDNYIYCDFFYERNQNSWTISFSIRIPVNEIEKYSSFKIVKDDSKLKDFDSKHGIMGRIIKYCQSNGIKM